MTEKHSKLISNDINGLIKIALGGDRKRSESTKAISEQTTHV